MKTKLLQMKSALRSILIVLLFSAIGVTNVKSQNFTVDDLNYSINVDGTSVTVTGPADGISIAGSLTIPPSIAYDGNVYSVTNIGDYAFHNCSGILGVITLPNSIVEVGEYAFFGCTSITELTIGENVTSIGNSAFWNCPNLVTVHFNAVNCTTMKTTIINNGITYNRSVFNRNNDIDGKPALTQLSIDEGVQNIPSQAFRNCSDLYQRLTLPYSLLNIGDNAFYGCSSLYRLLIRDSVTTIGNSAFSNCNGIIGSLVIPNSVTSIGSWAFSGCSGFTSLTIPESITTIKESTFQNCSGFTGDLIIPNSISSIEDNAFYHCDGFNGVLVLSDSLTSIGKQAFYGCSNFVDALTIPNTVTAIGKSAFQNCNGFNGSLSIGNSVVLIGDYAFYNCSGFNGCLIIPDNVTTIGKYAFHYCRGINNLIIGDNVSSIGESAFYGCNGINGALILGSTLSSIGYYAFAYCSGITSIISKAIIPPTIIDNNTFNGVDYSIPLHVPYGKKSSYRSATGWSLFYNCYNQFLFEEYEDQNWSTEDNWANGTLPSSSDVVCINSNCQLDQNVNVSYLYMRNNYNLTIQNDKSLITSIGIKTNNSTQLIIKDGGQLVNPLTNTLATVQKQITGYGNSEDGWYTISTPIIDGTQTSDITLGIYDLYYYDEPTAYWMNEKQVENNFVRLNPDQGYLYANQDDITLEFAGLLNASDAEISIPVYYSNGPLAGFNLVGNPFTNNISINSVAINGVVQTAYYKSIGGSNLVAFVSEDEEPIRPCEGFMVKATEAGTLSFNAPSERSEKTGNGYVRLLLNKDLTIADRAYLCISGDKTLEKICANGSQNQLYFISGGERFAIVKKGESPSIPLCLEQANGTYTIEAKLLNAECDYLHLIDNYTGIDVNLLDTPSYTFEAKTNDYVSRFKLVFSPSKDADDDNEKPFAYYADGEIHLMVETDNDSFLQMIDMTGRILVSSDTARNVTTSGMMPGVYVLRLISKDNVKTQKIVIR